MSDKLQDEQNGKRRPLPPSSPSDPQSSSHVADGAAISISLASSTFLSSKRQFRASSSNSRSDWKRKHCSFRR